MEPRLASEPEDAEEAEGPETFLELFTAALSLKRLVVPRWAPRLPEVLVELLPALLELLLSLADADEDPPELEDAEVSGVLEEELPPPPPMPPPPMPPRPRPLRLPRICGASRAAKRSAETTPVTRTVDWSSPVATALVWTTIEPGPPGTLAPVCVLT